ncbi:MAG: S8 family serine peptidase [Chloroflexota bacterium]|nr:S8 family serine peptidase [Chloroflexota bacterium]
MPESQEQMGVPWWNKMIIYWLPNQVCVSLHSPISLPAETDVQSPARFKNTVDSVMQSLKLDTLNEFLTMRGFKLKPLSPQDDLPSTTRSAPQIEQSAAHHQSRGWSFFETIQTVLEETQGSASAEFAVFSREQSMDDGGMPANLNSMQGKFLFPSPSHGTIVTSIFTIEATPSAYAMPGMSSMGGMGSGTGGDSESAGDMTRQVVDLINSNVEKLRQDAQVPVISAMPNWLNGGSPYGSGGCGAHGCPVVPAIPVKQAHAEYPLRLPDLSAVNTLKGDGVTVFVLDTLPDVEQIRQASQAANPNSTTTGNRLLEQIVEQIDRPGDPSVRFQHWTLPPIIENPGPEQPVTGRDIYGRLVGFAMPDHGLFVAGIVRDLAPNATIECIRVLNDYAIGNTAIVLSALQYIQARMLYGDLRERQVVINLSLVTTPAQEELPLIWFGAGSNCAAGDFADMMRHVELVRASLHRVIQSLTSLGAVVVAAAGNDSNVHAWNAPAMYGMNMAPRWGPRYPAAFPEVISVGAVDRRGAAAPYSNYPALFPQHNGIAAYGGGLPTPLPPAPGECMTHAKNIDGIVGVYSAASYPALSGDDCESTYPAPPDSHGWAAWTGTSFATPIVSALAARVLQRVRANGLPRQLWAAEVQRAITTTAGQQDILGRALAIQLEYDASLLMVQQDGAGEVQEGAVAQATTV